MVNAKPPKPCRTCKRATVNSNGYCDDHQSDHVGWTKRYSAWQGKGSTRSQRKERAAVLRRDRGLCIPCVAKGFYTLATQVDHVVNLASGGEDSMANKQSICDPCHKEKTAKESAQSRLQKGEGWVESL